MEDNGKTIDSLYTISQQNMDVAIPTVGGSRDVSEQLKSDFDVTTNALRKFYESGGDDLYDGPSLQEQVQSQAAGQGMPKLQIPHNRTQEQPQAPKSPHQQYALQMPNLPTAEMSIEDFERFDAMDETAIPDAEMAMGMAMGMQPQPQPQPQMQQAPQPQMQPQPQMSYVAETGPSPDDYWKVSPREVQTQSGRTITVYIVEDNLTEITTGIRYLNEAIAEKIVKVLNSTRDMEDQRIDLINDLYEEYIKTSRNLRSAKKSKDRRKVSMCESKLQTVKTRLGI